MNDGGKLGALTNRLAFFNEHLASWRSSIFLGSASSLENAADLGYGVLDAVVEAAAYICARQETRDILIVDILREKKKSLALSLACKNVKKGISSNGTYIRRRIDFERSPAKRIAYNVDPIWLRMISKSRGHTLYSGGKGVNTGGDFRFFRTFWEVQEQETSCHQWKWLAKGGAFSRFRCNTHLVVDWLSRCAWLRNRNLDINGKRGVTYTYRTTSNLSARVLNDEVMFSQGGPGLVVHEPGDASLAIVYLNSFVATYCLEILVGGGDYSVKGTAARNLEPRYLEQIPRITVADEERTDVDKDLRELLGILDVIDDDEANPLFRNPLLAANSSIHTAASRAAKYCFEMLERAYRIVEGFEKRVASWSDEPVDKNNGRLCATLPFPEQVVTLLAR